MHGAGIDQPWTDLAHCPGVANDDASPVDRNAVAVAMLSALLPALEGFDRGGLAPFLPKFATFDALAGREVLVRDGDREHVGVARGVAADGGLRLALAGGREQVFHAGETSVRAR